MEGFHTGLDNVKEFRRPAAWPPLVELIFLLPEGRSVVLQHVDVGGCMQDLVLKRGAVTACKP